MAKSGIEIFKLLPKTNCKKCGMPNCLTFAMKVAGGKASIEECPEIAPDVADGPGSLILDQVTNGVAVRMALLYLLVGGGRDADH